MADIVIDAKRFDPYKNFRFRLKWDGHYVAGISKVSALKRSTEVVEHRAGGDRTSMRKAPGLTKFEPITMERGVTHDTDFELWASRVWMIDNPLGRQIALAGFRKDLTLELHNEAGQVALVYKIHRAWVSEYVALPELDAKANAVAIQSIVVQHEGFQRDVDTPVPIEPATV